LFLPNLVIPLELLIVALSIPYSDARLVLVLIAQYREEISHGLYKPPVMWSEMFFSAEFSQANWLGSEGQFAERHREALPLEQ